MKRTVKFMLLLLVMAGVATLSSCQKDTIGTYAPKKKIQQLYYSYGYQDKTPLQHWEWNGDRLYSITHYLDYGFKSQTWIENFTYSDNHIVRVDNYTNNEYITYEYDGDHLKSATVFYRNAIACTWAVSYEGDHISKLSGTIYEDYKKDGASLHLNPLSHLLPPDVCKNVAKQEEKLAQQRHEDAYNIVLLLTWTDDNISEIVITGDGEYVNMKLQYDDKNCPWYCFIGGLEDYLTNMSAGHTGFTKHNVKSLVVTEGHYVDSVLYAYQYDSDNYPILQTMYYADDPDEKQVFYYEY